MVDDAEVTTVSVAWADLVSTICALVCEVVVDTSVATFEATASVIVVPTTF